jgi:hypothetical protein
MKNIFIAVLCLCSLGLPVQADQATADAIDNMNTGMWARELIGNGEGFTGFCSLSKSVANKIFGKKKPKKPKIEEVSNGNVTIDGKEYCPVTIRSVSDNYKVLLTSEAK